MERHVKLEVWGELAAFNRPEFKVERVSYDVMTPSAARGILEAIYWKPQMKWSIDEILVLKPIRFSQIRRNEISRKIPVAGASDVARAMSGVGSTIGISVDDPAIRVQRAALVLRDVRYGILAHVEVLDPTAPNGERLLDAEAKHLEMFKRRAARGQCFHRPYLGTREFPAAFDLVDSFSPVAPDLSGERDFGWMLLDVEFVPDAEGAVVESNRGTRRTARPRFFRAVARSGVITVPAFGGLGTSS